MTDETGIGATISDYSYYRIHPSIRISMNEQTGQVRHCYSGMGQLHLEIVQHRMIRD
jgi:hypothetical protein